MEIKIERLTKEKTEETGELLSENFDGVSKKLKFVENEHHFSLIALDKDKVIGHISIDKIDDPIKNISYYFLNYVCVKKEYQNRSIATLLLKEVEKHAKKDNVSYLELTSRKERKAAHHLYLKNDFVIRDTLVFKKMMEE